MISIIRTYKCRLARVTNLFRQQYSKIGNTKEQLFHAWRSFNFHENTETIFVYVTHIRQVAALLTTIFRSIQEYTPHKIILDTVSHRRP